MNFEMYIYFFQYTMFGLKIFIIFQKIANRNYFGIFMSEIFTFS